MKETIKRFLILFTLLGLVFLDVEYFLRAMMNERIHILQPTIMFFVGGLAVFSVGLINQCNFIRQKFNVFFQALLAAFTILTVEFLSGLLFNVALNLQLWDYTMFKFNLLGQIALEPGLLWFLISPMAFWLDDVLRFYFNKEGTLYNVGDVYLAFLNPFAIPQFQQILDKGKKNEENMD